VSSISTQRRNHHIIVSVLCFFSCMLRHDLLSRYIELVRKHELEISQPGLESDKKIAWRMTKRHSDQEVHK
jgi:hypothetical protein